MYRPWRPASGASSCRPAAQPNDGRSWVTRARCRGRGRSSIAAERVLAVFERSPFNNPSSTLCSAKRAAAQHYSSIAAERVLGVRAGGAGGGGCCARLDADRKEWNGSDDTLDQAKRCLRGGRGGGRDCVCDRVAAGGRFRRSGSCCCGSSSSGSGTRGSWRRTCATRARTCTRPCARHPPLHALYNVIYIMLIM
jgi:hypothetical protein